VLFNLHGKNNNSIQYFFFSASCFIPFVVFLCLWFVFSPGLLLLFLLSGHWPLTTGFTKNSVIQFFCVSAGCHIGAPVLTIHLKQRHINSQSADTGHTDFLMLSVITTMSTSELGQAATADTSVTKQQHSSTLIMVTDSTACSNNILSVRLTY
jgi:hypothetical protein